MKNTCLRWLSICVAFCATYAVAEGTPNGVLQPGQGDPIDPALAVATVGPKNARRATGSFRELAHAGQQPSQFRN